MNDINWLKAFADSLYSLFAWIWEGLAIGAAVASVCFAFGIDLVLFYVLSCTLTGEMLSRVILGLKRRKGLCRSLQQGITRYICYGVFLLVAVAVQVSFRRTIGLALPIADIFICYLILTDCSSILGNMEALGVPIPRPLRILVAQSRRKIGGAIEQAAKPKTVNPDEEGRHGA